MNLKENQEQSACLYFFQLGNYSTTSVADAYTNVSAKDDSK